MGNDRLVFIGASSPNIIKVKKMIERNTDNFNSGSHHNYKDKEQRPRKVIGDFVYAGDFI